MIQPPATPLEHHALRPPDGQVETPTEAAERLADIFGTGPRLVVTGSETFQSEDNERIVRLFAKMLTDRMGGNLCLITGGGQGVQRTFAQHCSPQASLYNVLPAASSGSDFECGTDAFAGHSVEDHQAILALVGDVYFTVEGGEAVAKLARHAADRNADVVPLIRSGGASGGLFGFPPQALRQLQWASTEQWQHLKDTNIPVYQTAATCADIVIRVLKLWEPVPWSRGSRQGKRKQPVRAAKSGPEVGGAPVPLGMASPMASAGQRDLRSAFTMLDTNKDGKLTVPQAKEWLRCAGWVLPDQELGRMLSKKSMDPDATLSLDELFTRFQLMEVSTLHHTEGNYSLERFKRDLKMLSEHKNSMSRSTLIDILMNSGGSDLTRVEVETMLQLMGLGKDHELDTAGLATSLFSAICRPPDAMDILKVRDQFKHWPSR